MLKVTTKHAETPNINSDCYLAEHVRFPGSVALVGAHSIIVLKRAPSKVDAAWSGPGVRVGDGWKDLSTVRDIKTDFIPIKGKVEIEND